MVTQQRLTFYAMSEDVIDDDKELLEWRVRVIKHSSEGQRRVEKFFDHQLEHIQQIGPLHGHWILS